jgi:DNA repair exonuclease SbcCD ATPase subunit
MLIDFGDVADVVNVKFPIPYTLKNGFSSKYINRNTIDGVFDVNKIYNNILTNFIVVDTDAKKTEFVYQMFTLIGYVNLLQVNNKKYQIHEELIIQLAKLNETLAELNETLAELNETLAELNEILQTEQNKKPLKKHLKKVQSDIEECETDIEECETDIEECETKIEAIKEEIEEYELHYTNPNITFSKYPFRDMYELLNTNKKLFPIIYDAFMANRQPRQEHIGGYKKEKRKKTVTKQNNKKKIQHKKTKKRQVK